MNMWWIVVFRVFSVLGVLFSILCISRWIVRYIKSLIAEQIRESEWEFLNKLCGVKNLVYCKHRELEEMIKKARGEE